MQPPSSDPEPRPDPTAPPAAPPAEQPTVRADFSPAARERDPESAGAPPIDPSSMPTFVPQRGQATERADYSPATPGRPPDLPASLPFRPPSGPPTPGCDGSATVRADFSPAARAGSAAAGGAFGRYQLVERLGAGGMGVVWKAWDPSLRRTVALKLIREDQGADREAVERFLREARLAAKLRHPHILPVHDVCAEAGRHYLTTEFVEGRTLADHLEETRVARRNGAPQGPARLRQDVTILAQVAEAIGFAHRQGVIHRDLKPANVLLDREEHPWVADFGLAKEVGAAPDAPPASRPGLTLAGQVLGTPCYMSPEQAAGEVGEIGPASDVWALGVLLYEILAGETPFEHAGTPWEILRAVSDEDPRPPRDRNRQVPADLEALALCALEKDRRRRCASADAFAEDLRRWLRGEPVEARRPTPLYRLWRKAVRHRAAVAAGVGALALFAGALGTWVHARGVERERAELAERNRAALREKAGLWLDATLKLRRAGLSMDSVRRDYLPKLREASREAATLEPGRAEPHYHLGRMLRALLSFAEARDEQDAALACEPDYAPSRYERAVLRSGEYRDRLERLRTAWLAEEGRRLRSAGEPGGGVGGSRPRPLPSDDELTAADPEARAMREDLVRDLTRLEAPAASGTPDGTTMPGARACARGLFLLHAGGPAGRAEARALLEQAIAEAPMLEEAHAGLADLALAEKAYAAAAAAHGRALEVDRGYVPAWIGRGIARHLEGRERMDRGEVPLAAYDEAIGDFTRALELDPGAVAAWIRRGQSRTNRYFWRNRRGEDAREDSAAAIEDFGRALALDPRSVEARASRAHARHIEATIACKLGADPDARFAGALEDFDAALALAPASAGTWMERGSTRAHHAAARAAQGGDAGPLWPQAVADLDRALDLDPSRASAWLQRGAARTMWAEWERQRGGAVKDRIAAAIADLDRALELDRADARAWHARADAHGTLGRATEDEAGGAAAYAAAVADFGEAIARNEAWAEPWARRGRVRGRMAWLNLTRGNDPSGLVAEAVADLDRALALDPGVAEVWRDRGGCRLNGGTWRHGRGEDPEPLYIAAEADFDRALELDPRSAEAWQRRGEVRANRAAWRRARAEDPRALFAGARDDYTRALALAPDAAETWFRRAQAHVNESLWVEERAEDPGPGFAAGIADLDRTLALRPDWIEARLKRGAVRSWWGTWQFAHGGSRPPELWQASRDDYAEVARLRPGHVEALLGLGRAETMLEHWDAVVAAYEAAARLDPSREAALRPRIEDARRRMAAPSGKK